jgi:hypothetical protein
VDRDTYYRLKYDTIIGSDFPGKVIMNCTDGLPFPYKEIPFDEEQVTLRVSNVVNRYLYYCDPMNDIESYMYKREMALKSNNLEELEEWNEKLQADPVFKFLEKVCSLDKFSIYLFQEDVWIHQRVEYTKDKSIMELLSWVLNSDDPQTVEIYSR